jgi:hypothetical protein
MWIDNVALDRPRILYLNLQVDVDDCDDLGFERLPMLSMTDSIKKLIIIFDLAQHNDETRKIDQTMK